MLNACGGVSSILVSGGEDHFPAAIVHITGYDMYTYREFAILYCANEDGMHSIPFPGLPTVHGNDDSMHSVPFPLCTGMRQYTLVVHVDKCLLHALVEIRVIAVFV